MNKTRKKIIHRLILICNLYVLGVKIAWVDAKWNITPEFISQKDQCKKLNNLSDFENKTPTHMSAIHANSKLKQRFQDFGIRRISMSYWFIFIFLIIIYWSKKLSVFVAPEFSLVIGCCSDKKQMIMFSLEFAKVARKAIHTRTFKCLSKFHNHFTYGYEVKVYFETDLSIVR